MDVDALVETWRGPLTGLLAGWGASWTDAAELAQDVIVEAYLARGRLRGDASDPAVVGPWLRGIARNLHAAWRRKRERTRELHASDVPPQAPEDDPRCADPRVDDLRRAIERLPHEEREAVYLHYLEETRVREVAALLGVTEKTVEGRLHRARTKLREALDRRSLARGGRTE